MLFNKSKRNPAGHNDMKVGGERFRLGSWLRLHGFDIITMALMGALGLGIYFAPPAPSRSFPVYFENGQVVYPQFAYPRRRQIIPIVASALISFFVPFIFITLFQIRRRSIDDWLTSTLGVLKSLITAAVFQVFIKWLIGGLRPHFYDVCQPNVQANSAPSGTGFARLMYDRTVCQGDQKQINDALESMPSGHSTAAWAGLLFLSLYFNAQLKVMSAHNPAYWKMVLFFAPLLGATLISGSLTIDAYHNWYDVLAGAIIGSVAALVAFRQTFAAIWDFRFNHILLPRASSLFHRSSKIGAGAYHFYPYQVSQSFASRDLPFTREGGWAEGAPQHFGAPGDVSGFSASMGGAGGMPGVGTSQMGNNGMYRNNNQYGNNTHNGMGSNDHLGNNNNLGNSNRLGNNDNLGNSNHLGNNNNLGNNNHLGNNQGVMENNHGAANHAYVGGPQVTV